MRDIRSLEARYFWNVVSKARQLKAAGQFRGPATDDILDDLSAIAVCTTWPVLRRLADEAGQTFTEWLEAA